jgi:hypothetical protein
MLQSLYSQGQNPRYSSGIFTVMIANNKRTVSNSSSVILKLEKTTMKLQTLFPSLITLFANRKMWWRQEDSNYLLTVTQISLPKELFWSHGKDRQQLTKTLLCTSIINQTTTKYKALLLTYLGFFLYKTLNSQLHFSACNNKGSRVFQWQTKHSFCPAVCPANSITISIITALFRDEESLAIWARHQIKRVCIIYTHKQMIQWGDYVCSNKY